MVVNEMNLVAISTITPESTNISSDVDEKFVELNRRHWFISKALKAPKWTNSVNLSARQKEIETRLFMWKCI